MGRLCLSSLGMVWRRRRKMKWVQRKTEKGEILEKKMKKY